MDINLKDKKEGILKIRIEAVGGDLDRVVCKYPASFMDEMARQLGAAIEAATGVNGIADSSVELVMVFAPATYMEHISGNVTYRRLMLVDAVSAPRDFWVKWTRLEVVEGEYNSENILFELGEDVEQNIRQREYKYLLMSGKEKYHNSMGRKKVTEWREVIKRAVKRGELGKVEKDNELAPETLALEARIADVLGKKLENKNTEVEHPSEHIEEQPVSEDYARALEKARMMIEGDNQEDEELTLSDIVEEVSTDDTVDEKADETLELVIDEPQSDESLDEDTDELVTEEIPDDESLVEDTDESETDSEEWDEEIELELEEVADATDIPEEEATDEISPIAIEEPDIFDSLSEDELEIDIFDDDEDEAFESSTDMSVVDNEQIELVVEETEDELVIEETEYKLVIENVEDEIFAEDASEPSDEEVEELIIEEIADETDEAALNDSEELEIEAIEELETEEVEQLEAEEIEAEEIDESREESVVDDVKAEETAEIEEEFIIEEAEPTLPEMEIEIYEEHTVEVLNIDEDYSEPALEEVVEKQPTEIKPAPAPEKAPEMPNLAERVADIRAQLEVKIRLEYETRAREKAEAEVAELRRKLHELYTESELAIAELKNENERLRDEYNRLVDQIESERFARDAEETRFRIEEKQLRDQIEAQLRAEAAERERLAENARQAIADKQKLEAENARIAREREEAERLEAERLRREEEAREIEAIRQAELERLRREREEELERIRLENEAAIERAKKAMPEIGDGKPSHTSKTVRLLFRKPVDPNITVHIHKIIKNTVDYYGKDNVSLRIRATIPDIKTVVLEFVDIPIEEMPLLGNIIKVLGNSGLGISKAFVE